MELNWVTGRNAAFNEATMETTLSVLEMSLRLLDFRDEMIDAFLPLEEREDEHDATQAKREQLEATLETTSLRLDHLRQRSFGRTLATIDDLPEA